MAKRSNILKSKPSSTMQRQFAIGDDVLVGKSRKHKGVTGEVMGYFMNSNSHCHVLSSTLGRLIVPQEELKALPMCPWRQALFALVGVKPPDWVRGDLSKLSDAQHLELADWIGTNLQPRMEWSTSIGVIDAACSLVREAADNGNFKRYPSYVVR